MNQEFDPYYKWLGIAPEEQPPNRYRLLSIRAFESDPDVIESAAGRIIFQLQDLAGGEHIDHSQRLLNEVSRARVCLLNLEQKARYDAELKATIADANDSETRKASKRFAPRRLLVIGAATAVILIVGFSIVTLILVASRESDVVAAGRESDDGQSFAIASSVPRLDVSPVPTEADEQPPAPISLTVRRVTGPDGADRTADKDGWYPLTPTAGEPTTYTVVASVSQGPLTGINVAWQGDGGSVCLNELELFGGVSEPLYDTHRLALTVADSEPILENSPCQRSVDRNISTACIVPLSDTQVTLQYRFAEPLKVGAKGPVRLRLVLHTSGKYSTGRFMITPVDEPIVVTLPLAAATPKDGRTLAYWRFDDGSPNAAVKTLQQLGFPAAAKDESRAGNSLYCPRPAVAPKHTAAVPAAEVRRRETMAPNAGSLDDTQPPTAGETGRYLISDSVRAKPAVDVERYGLPQWTVEASIRLASLDTLQTLICKNGRPTALGAPPLKLRFDGDKKQLSLDMVDRRGTVHAVATPADFMITADQWIHVVAVCDGTKLSLYAFPAEAAAIPKPVSTGISGGLIDSVGHWTVGAALGEETANGDTATEDALAMIDEVRISGVALKPEDFLFAARPEQVVRDPPLVPPKTDDPPQQQPQNADPFAEVSVAVALPIVDPEAENGSWTDPVELGTLGGESGAELDIRLVGGESGHGTDGVFSLQSAAGDARASWTIQYLSSAKGSPDGPQTIASLALSQQSLTFRWNPVVGSLPAANYLRNCALLLQQDRYQHVVDLRTPLISVPLALSLARAAVRDTDLGVPFPPDPKSLRVQFLVTSDNPLPHNFESADPMPVGGDQKRIVLGGTDDRLFIRLESEWRNSAVRFRLAPRCELGLGSKRKERAFSIRKLETAKQDLAAAVDIAQVRAFLKSRPAFENKIKEKQPTTVSEFRSYRQSQQRVKQLFGTTDAARIEAQLVAIGDLRTHYDRMLRLAEQLNAGDGALIQFRIFRLAGEREQELARSNNYPVR